MNKKLYIELLEKKVEDQNMTIGVLEFTSKCRDAKNKEKILKANDDFFSLGDACREQINKMAREQLANLESDQIFDEMVESFKCASDRKIEELEKTIADLKVLNHELLVENKKLLYKAAKKNEQR